MTTFNHFNFNVLDLDRSLAFYKQALNLTPAREKTAEAAPSSWCSSRTRRPAPSSWS